MFDTRVKDRAFKRNAQVLLNTSELSSKIRLASSAPQAGVARASQPQVKHRSPSRVAPSSMVPPPANSTTGEGKLLLGNKPTYPTRAELCKVIPQNK